MTRIIKEVDVSPCEYYAYLIQNLLEDINCNRKKKIDVIMIEKNDYFEYDKIIPINEKFVRRIKFRIGPLIKDQMINVRYSVGKNHCEYSYYFTLTSEGKTKVEYSQNNYSDHKLDNFFFKFLSPLKANRIQKKVLDNIDKTVDDILKGGA